MNGFTLEETRRSLGDFEVGERASVCARARLCVCARVSVYVRAYVHVSLGANVDWGIKRESRHGCAYGIRWWEPNARSRWLPRVGTPAGSYTCPSRCRTIPHLC